MKKLFLLLILFNSTSALASFTVSGISSGAFMASQLGVIYSDQVSGVGSVAGGFYYCAQNHFQERFQQAKILNISFLSLFQARVKNENIFSWNLDGPIGLDPKNPIYQSVGICMREPEKSVIRFDVMKKNQDERRIADLSNLRNQKVFIYQGKSDSVVRPAMLAKMKEFYQALQIPDSQVKIVEGRGGHNFPTDQEGLDSCFSQSVPYVASCKNNLAGDLLSHLLNDSNLLRSQNQNENLKNLHLVTQTMGGSQKPKSLASYGYLAASPECLSNPGQCRLHVAFHGCAMSDSFDQAFDERYSQVAKLGYLQMRNREESLPFSTLPYIEQRELKFGLLRFVMQSGYLDYVKDNHLMVLFPQTWITEGNYPMNPKGCWDWFGWTGSEYATNQGQEPQWLIRWIQQMQQNPKAFLLNRSIDFKKVQ
ncbi:MAG: hypothetical protein ACAH59_13700 [Pseudobdellovibrionaceae bacterium]